MTREWICHFRKISLRYQPIVASVKESLLAISLSLKPNATNLAMSVSRGESLPFASVCFIGEGLEDGTSFIFSDDCVRLSIWFARAVMIQRQKVE